jgi:putative membrane protein
MDFGYIKALHIIFVVTWFAGLFYIVRLFIYHREAEEEEEPKKSILQEQFKLMEKRLWYGITWPSAILTLVFATWMLIDNPAYLKLGYMHVKLGFVFLLYLYHLSCGYIFRQQQKGIFNYTSTQLRVWNEVATLFLVSIVFIIILRSTINWLYGLLGLIIFTVVLMLAIRIYKKLRTRS